MVFFSQGFIDFFQELRANNDRDWFNANKPRYISEVKEPWEKFVAHMIEAMRPTMPELLITPKESIFRIYRDTRFSKDKTPYKEHVSAALAPGGRKDFSSIGLYLQANNDEVRIYSGAYMPDKEQLMDIRNRIAHDPEGFKRLYSEPKFVKYFGEIRGEKNKRLPKDLREAADIEPLIFIKGFYYFATLPAKDLLSKTLTKKILDRFEVCRPLGDFFNQ